MIDLTLLVTGILFIVGAKVFFVLVIFVSVVPLDWWRFLCRIIGNVVFHQDFHHPMQLFKEIS